MYIEKFFKTCLRENSAFIFLFYENLLPLKKRYKNIIVKQKFTFGDLDSKESYT